MLSALINTRKSANVCHCCTYLALTPLKPIGLIAQDLVLISTLGGIRTPDTRLRTAVFYPAELRGLTFALCADI